MTIDISTIPAEHLPWMLAGAWKECDALGGCTYREDGGRCSCCNSTNHIYALPNTVWVSCPAEYHNAPGKRDGPGPFYCFFADGVPVPSCYGCGYTPSTDLAVWIDAALSLGTHAVIFTPPQYDGLLPVAWIVSKTQNHLEDIQRALASLLQVKGYTLGEVPKGVPHE